MFSFSLQENYFLENLNRKLNKILYNLKTKNQTKSFLYKKYIAKLKNIYYVIFGVYRLSLNYYQMVSFEL